MLREFRYIGISNDGKQISGVINAKNFKEAKKIAEQLSQKYNFSIRSLTKKKDWLYYVVLPSGKKFKGRQQAYSKEELESALKKVGYTVKKIEPVLFDIPAKPSFEKIMLFVQMSAFMLKEQMSYDKILQLLAEEEEDRVLREALKKIQSELKKGKEGTEVFKQFEHVFGKFPAYMLGLATKSGNMADVYEATAKFLERDFEYKKNLRSAFLSPMFIVLATIGAVLYYVMNIFPKTAKIFVDMGIKVPPMTKWTLDASDYLKVNWWWWAIIFIIPIISIYIWFKTEEGQVFRDKLIINLPVIGKIFHKTSIEIFFRVFAAIYSGSENNIETLQASAEACRNKYIEKGVKEIAIPLMLKDGMSLIPALTKADVFNRATLSRLRSGAETGNILISANQIARFYEKENTYKMNALINSIQTWIGLFIAIAITLLTVVSSEIATVSPPTGF